MPLINTSLPNLIQGVSQQPDSARYDGQCELQENALSSIVDGLRKRPNTKHVAKILDEAIIAESYIHFINRSETERYVAVYSEQKLRIFNLNNGTEATIADTTVSASGVTGGVNVSYLNSTTPRTSLEFMTVADFTFLLNKDTTVLADTNKTSSLLKSPYIYVAQGDFEKEYTITGAFAADTSADAAFASVGGSFTSGASTDGNNASTETIRDGLSQATEGSPEAGSIWADVAGEGLWSTYNVETCATKDGLSGQGLQLVYKEIDSSAKLPAFCVNGHKVKVSGDPELSQDDFYAEFVVDNPDTITVSNNDFGGGGVSYTTGEGHWKETSGIDVSLGLDDSTMPHTLVNTGVNTFEVRTGAYTDRAAGDDDSNPQPSFVNNKISSMFFFKNRLGFLSRESVIMSEAGQFFNFYRTTVTSLLDSAPIDVSVSTTKVTNLQHATGFQENLILFGSDQQFVLKGGDLLTPRTVSISPITNFDTERNVKPIPVGSYIYFPFTRGSFTGLREFTVNSSSDTYDSVDITEHVPSYIPSNIIDMAGTTSEDILALVSSDEPSSIYIYKYFWSGVKKLLSSWSKFTVRGNIRGIEFIDSELFLIVSLNEQTHILNAGFESGLSDPIGFVTHLDMRVSRTVTAGTDSISLPYSTTPDDNVQVWTKDGAYLESTSNLNSVQLAQPVSTDTDVWVGLTYTMKYQFSEQIFKAAVGQGKSPSNAAKVMIRNISLFHNNTAAFDVKVTPKFRDTFTSSFTPTIVGSSTIGNLTLDDGAFRVPVFTKAKDTVITIESDSALPCAFQSVEFESFIHSRSNRTA